MAEYFSFFFACIGLTLLLIGWSLWLDHQRLVRHAEPSNVRPLPTHKFPSQTAPDA